MKMIRKGRLLAAFSLAAVTIISAAPVVNAADAQLGSLQVCKAAISAMMGRPVGSMSGAEDDGLATISYVRAADGKKFWYQCRSGEFAVAWRTKIDGSWGRWRADPADSKITYRVADGQVVIFEDGQELGKFSIKTLL